MTDPHANIDVVIREVCRGLHIDTHKMYQYAKLTNKSWEVTECCHTVCFFMRVYEDLSYDALATFFGFSNHSSVIYAVNHVIDRLENDEFNMTLTAIKSNIYGTVRSK